MDNAFKIKKGLLVQASGSTAVDIQGNSGQLFSITDSLTGVLMSVNDISGLPILEVSDNDQIKMGTFGNEAIIVTGNTASITGSFKGDGSQLTNLPAAVPDPLTVNRLCVGSGHGATLGTCATIAGGQNNTASGTCATIAGGQNNTASGYFSFVGGGGFNNTASGTNGSTISGGLFNTASGNNSTIAGGTGNTACGAYSTISGGQFNTASGVSATIGGGGIELFFNFLGNTASGNYSTVGGGNCNLTSGISSIIGGGSFNTASGNCSTVGGGFNNTASGQRSTISGGQFNTASGYASTISGGGWCAGGNYGKNIATGNWSTIGGGYSNRAYAQITTVSGGAYNRAVGTYSTVGGGRFNYACGFSSTSVGGCFNKACQCGSTTLGGLFNTSNHSFSSVSNCAQTTSAACQFRVQNLSKASGTFRINHPDPTKTCTHYLSHSFVESPTAGDNIYRWNVDVVNGQAIIELPSYYKFLNTDDQVWVTPQGHYGSGYGIINEEQTQLTIFGNTDGEYNILLIGTRKDFEATHHWHGVETYR